MGLRTAARTPVTNDLTSGAVGRTVPVCWLWSAARQWPAVMLAGLRPRPGTAGLYSGKPVPNARGLRVEFNRPVPKVRFITSVPYD